MNDKTEKTFQSVTKKEWRKKERKRNAIAKLFALDKNAKRSEK